MILYALALAPPKLREPAGISKGFLIFREGIPI